MSGPVDEAPHEAGADRRWGESWYVDFSDVSGRGGFLRLVTWPNLGRAWVWAVWVDGDRLVLVRDHDVPLPRGGGIEVRATGLWADFVREASMSHWTHGLEAFGVALDDPADAWGDERGHRTPLGFDLEWEALAPPFDHPGASVRPGEGHYQHHGRVHGEVLVGDDTIAFDGTGERDHSWGVRDWWDVGWHWAAFQLGERICVSVARPDRPGTEHATGYVAIEGGEPHPVLQAAVSTGDRVGSFPARVRYELETGLVADAQIVAVTPVLVPPPDGGPAGRLTRALCRFDSDEGGGTGWVEWMETPG